MATLSASARSRLPDSAFAYIDSQGVRRLPINDAVHVRNALARFEQVTFDSDTARERARERVLRAAKRHGIVPLGFFDGQLRKERERRSSVSRKGWPRGAVTFLLTDIEGSTRLLERLGDVYAKVLRDVRGLIRVSVRRAGGHEVDARADEFFAVFEQVAPAIDAAVGIHRALAGKTWGDDIECRVRAGIHSGSPTLTEAGYIGLSVHTAARVCQAAHGGQTLISGRARDAARDSMPTGVRLRSLGRHRLAGLTHTEALFQVEPEGLPAEFPPLRTDVAP